MRVRVVRDTGYNRGDVGDSTEEMSLRVLKLRKCRPSGIFRFVSSLSSIVTIAQEHHETASKVV